MFFLDDNLCRRRVQDIKSITAGRVEMRRGVERWVHDVEMDDGTKLVVLDVTVQQIGKLPVHTFAAESGLMVWTPDPDSGDDFLNPIVGWGISWDGEILPIAAGGSIDDSDAGAVILAVDGRVWRNGFVLAPDLATFKSLAANE